ncbi:LysR family glycine cleavage system transcriptional activator [Humitalea rosea]|uniref:LysR family glycine cleavage system transcriptional activator n=1 Tax=Humitalea rosea TaxID=990373 RepID=A0A2W7J9G8_9PROT|nr:transcriptional regulator GcvA [Humitalea rosea]PZW48642.1 LysR family glycine cleavage system transcriptional activator [Humitalea rosea]
MAWQLPPLNALRAFEAAARYGSFAQAAEELCVTPGAISRQVKLLEANLGVQLFVRANRQVRLTAESAQYVATLTELFRRLDVATGRLRDARRERPLRIMCSANVATRWVFPRLRMFHAQYPNRHVLLTTSLTSAAVAFSSDSADIVIRLGTDDWPADVVAHRLFDSELTPVCSPRLLRHGPRLREPEDLKNHTLLCSDIRPAGWGQWLAMVGLPPLETFNAQKFESSALVYEAAAEGLGIAMGEKHLVRDELRSGRLVAPWPISLRQPEAFYLIYQRQMQATPQLREFRDWILQQDPDAERVLMLPRAVRSRAP